MTAFGAKAAQWLPFFDQTMLATPLQNQALCDCGFAENGVLIASQKAGLETYVNGLSAGSVLSFPLATLAFRKLIPSGVLTAAGTRGSVPKHARGCAAPQAVASQHR